MQDFLIQVSYTQGAFASLVANPQDRSEAVRPVIESLGGSLKSAYFSFGDYDVILIASLPSAVEAAAVAMAFSAGGALKAVRTTPLLSIAEGLEAMKKAGSCGYKAVKATA